MNEIISLHIISVIDIKIQLINKTFKSVKSTHVRMSEYLMSVSGWIEELVSEYDFK